MRAFRRDAGPPRADYLDTVVWDHITGLLADPALIRAEIDRRLTQARASGPVTRQRKQLELALGTSRPGWNREALVEFGLRRPGLRTGYDVTLPGC